MDHLGSVLEGWRLRGISISPAQVGVEVRYRIRYCHSEPLIAVISIVICYEYGVMLCFVDLHDCDMVL